MYDVIMEPQFEDRMREIAREEIDLAGRITALEIAILELREELRSSHTSIIEEVREARSKSKTMETALMNEFGSVHGRIDELNENMQNGFRAVLDTL